MRKNPVIALLLTVVMLFAVVAPVMARTPEEIMAIRHYFQTQIDTLRAADKMSNDEVYGIRVDLSLIPQQGEATATVYKTAYEQVTVTNYSNIKLQPIEGINGAHDKVTRFWFYLDNNDDENFLAQCNAPQNTVIGYVYGATKDQTLAAFVAGIPDCLEQQRLYDTPSGGDGSSSPSSKPLEETKTVEVTQPDSWAEKYITTKFTLNTTTYSVLSTTQDTPETVSPEVKTMDVAPYVKNDRTYVPVRYLAYSLGVPEEGVSWNSDTQQIGISKGDTNISLTIGSATMSVNNMPITMDVAPEITNNRTFLPARWVAEALGAEVTWDDTTKDAVIRMPIGEPGN